MLRKNDPKIGSLIMQLTKSISIEAIIQNKTGQERAQLSYQHNQKKKSGTDYAPVKFHHTNQFRLL